MQIDIIALRSKGKSESDFEFSYTAPNEIITLPNVKFLGDVKVSGNLQILSRSEVIVDAKINYVLEGCCSRCFDNATSEIETSFSERFSEKDAEDSYKFFSGLLDLTKAVDDNIIMSMPNKLLCSDDCKGICVNCGKNLNKENCCCDKQ